MAQLDPLAVEVLRLYGANVDIAVIAERLHISRSAVGDLVSAHCGFHRGRAATIARAGTPTVLVARDPEPVTAVKPAADTVPAVPYVAGRELDLLRELVTGDTFPVIAARMGISMGTAKTYARRLFERLSVNRRDAAIKAGIRFGLISAEQDTPEPTVRAPKPTVVAVYRVHRCDTHRYDGPASGHRCAELRPVVVTVTEALAAVP